MNYDEIITHCLILVLNLPPTIANLNAQPRLTFNNVTKKTKRNPNIINIINIFRKFSSADYQKKKNNNIKEHKHIVYAHSLSQM